jgi:hypothetical protein
MNNPIKQIGRYQIPIGSVLAVQKRTGLLGFIWPGYDVWLAGGVRLRLTAAEKAELDEARGLHEQVLAVMGMVGHQQLFNRPPAGS